MHDCDPELQFQLLTEDHLSSFSYKKNVIYLIDVPLDSSQLKFGQVDYNSGKFSLQCVELSINILKQKLADGVVHCPISKESWQLAGSRFVDHTEMLGYHYPDSKIAMGLSNEVFKLVLATKHLPLAQVGENLTVPLICDTILVAQQWMHDIGISRPYIGVCALNPHAGENGLFGTEEVDIIRIAIRELQNKDQPMRLDGPIPADSALYQCQEGKYDCLVCMYHDQAFIPLKVSDRHHIVNVTLGLPFPRTSPGHGTAFDIVGHRIAKPDALAEAIRSAASMCMKKKYVSIDN